jgi:hypothetical protein
MEVLGRRCEQLMRAAEREVEQLEKKVREESGMPVEAKEGSTLQPIGLPSFKEMQRTIRLRKRQETEEEKKNLEQAVEGIEKEMKEIQERLKDLNKAAEVKVNNNTNNTDSKKRPRPAGNNVEEKKIEEASKVDESRGALGPDGDFIEFPEYDGVEAPRDPKKAFTQFCLSHRKQVKASLDPADRKNKVGSKCSIFSLLLFTLSLTKFSFDIKQDKVNGILRDKWLALSDEERQTWRKWATWDKKRFARDTKIYETSQKYANENSDEETSQEAVEEKDAMKEINVPKKRSLPHVPKKQRWS